MRSSLSSPERHRNPVSNLLKAVASVAALTLSACGVRSEEQSLQAASDTTITLPSSIVGIDKTPIGPYEPAERHFERAAITASTARVMNGPYLETIKDQTVSLHALIQGNYFNTDCSGSEVHINGQLGGWLSAKHCVPANLSVAVFDGYNFDTGTETIISADHILRDPNKDIVYLAANGFTPDQVKQQIQNNIQQARLSTMPANSALIGSGYPALGNVNRDVRLLELSYAGKMDWSLFLNGTPIVTTFGNWSVDGSSCSPGSSGGGLWWVDLNGNPVLIGALADRREFVPSSTGLWTMPYTVHYGSNDLRDGVFGPRLGSQILADFMCGYTQP